MPAPPKNYGTIQYIEDLENILNELDGLRKHLGRFDRKERFTITKAMESIRTLRARSKRHGLRLGLLSEDDV